MHRCRGFGVQSPTDYSFVRYVVNEHWPYYAYADICAKQPGMGWRERKLGELYLRLANFRQPSTIVNLPPGSPLYAEYFEAGCRKSRLTHDLSEAETVELLRMDVGSAAFDEVVAKADDRSIVVVEGIHRDRQSRRRWREMKARAEVHVTFDLYYVGILTFDSKRYKKHYTINF